MNRSTFRFPQPANALRFDGERFVSGLLGDISSGDIQSEHYHRYLFALQFCEGKDVLDIASGEGYGSYCLGQVARSVVGVDASAEAVDFANRNYLTDRVSFAVGKTQSIPIIDQSIDVVVSFETLEHFTEHDAFAFEIRRVLRPGGLLVMSSPNRTVYTEKANYHNEWHLRELDRGEFVDYLAAAFVNVRIFAQRPLAGSVIAADDSHLSGRLAGFILRGDGIFHRTEGVPHPPFFVAVASDVELPDVRTSILQNPALLQHIDTQRQNALDEAAQTHIQMADCERALAKAMEELQQQAVAFASVEADRTALIASLDRSRSETQQARLDLAKARADAEQARADAEQARADVEQARSAVVQTGREAEQGMVVVELARTVLEKAAKHELAELRRTLNLTGQSTDRIETVRQELTAARRRNLELANEAEALRRDRDEYATQFNCIVQSTAWKATLPLRRFSAHLPFGLRRTLRLGVRTGWRLTALRRASPEAGTVTLDPSPPGTSPGRLTADQAVEPSPSDLQRRLDASWVQPDERPDFIHLRGLRAQAKIAVVMHIYYPEVWQELAHAVSRIPEKFDLFVTLVTGASDALQSMITQHFPDAHVLLVDNHGRDIFPFIELIRTGVLFDYELICKVHSKRSTYREGGDEWRKCLIDGILGSTELVANILDLFRSDPDLGMVVAPGQIFGGRAFWVSNEARSSKLFRDIGLNESAFERKFAGGSMYWIRPLILRPINALKLAYDDFEPEPISNDGYTAHAVERLVTVVCYDAGMRAEESNKLVPSWPQPSAPKVHVIANYLPQFHPTPENDAWWGKGFTEWTNVTKALPLFRGHRQPRLSTDLGFYDLRLPDTRMAQAELARHYGITAFSYYYYWFNGRKLLNHPIEAVVASGEPDFPFMLCWANEPWTRNWDGLSKEILLPQDYAPGWERAFAVDVAQIMRDPRYLRLNGNPMLGLYRVAHFPDKIGSIVRLRAALEEEGFPAIHLMGAWVQIGDDEPLPIEAADLGLDAYFEFPPHGIPSQTMEIPISDRNSGFAAHVYDYGATVDAVLDQLALSQPHFRYRGVMMGWDNTARRGARSFAFHGATPVNFRRWLRTTIRTAQSEARGPETVVFINAWNEWAEGTYLEPDRDFGTGWLEAVASATADSRRSSRTTYNPALDDSADLVPIKRKFSVRMRDFFIDDYIERHLEPPVPDDLARRTCGIERDHLGFVRSGAEVFLMLELATEKYFGVTIAEIENILDFGCGAGRILRFLDPDMKGVCGCDVNEQVARFAQENYRGFSIHRNDLMPPLIYSSAHFGLIYSFAVFSHLPQDVEDMWLAELNRIGKPGCIYLISVHGDWFIEATRGDEATAIIADGFVYKTSPQMLGAEDTSLEYDAPSFHTAAYIRKNWSRYFDIIDVVKGDNPFRFLGDNPDPWSASIASQLRPMGQDLVVAKKR